MSAFQKYFCSFVGRFKDNIETSKIYQYYDENKERIINYWKQKGCYE